MKRQLILVHGRSQQGKPPQDLKDAWVGAWEEGLRAQGLKIPISDADIKFPYYGDTLMELVDGDDSPVPVTVHGEGQIDDPYGLFLAVLLLEVQKWAAIPDTVVREEAAAMSLNAGGTYPGAPVVIEHGVLNWPIVHALLRAIDRYVPGASSALLATVTRDIYLYLTQIGIRDRIEQGVLQAFSDRAPAVVVGHSLGSVVCYNLLRREGTSLGWDIPLFVTLGSPLGIEQIRRLMWPLSHPRCVGRWYNAMDKRDVVSLYPLDSDRFGVEPAIVNHTSVRNDTSNAHGITGYLKDPTVARQIYHSLMAQGKPTRAAPVLARVST